MEKSFTIREMYLVINTSKHLLFDKLKEIIFRRNMIMIKRLIGSIREFKKASILTPLYVTMEVVMEVLIPIMMSRLIDFGIDEGSMAVILKMGALLLLFAFISLFFWYFSGAECFGCFRRICKKFTP